MKRVYLFMMMLFLGCSAYAQWPETPEENKRLVETTFYTSEIGMLPDGSFYIFLDRPDGPIVPFLYYFDKDGNMVWDEPIEITRQPTLTWTKTMSHLLVDKDGNAVIGVQNTKLQMGELESYTAFKINKEGEFLWGKEGVDLHGGEIPSGDFNAALKLTQLADGSYIFAYMADEIILQKVSSDGKVQWGAGKKMGAGVYPYVVDAGDNEFILFYQSSGLMARKLDFDGNDIWAQPTVVFSGELNPSIPAWTYLEVIPAAGGFVAGWYGFEGDAHYSMCAYIKPDGSHAYIDADKGLRLSYGDFYGYAPRLAFNEEDKCVYAVFDEAIPGQSYARRVAAQKVSESGELLWNPQGVELASPYEGEGTVGYTTVSCGPKGSGIFAYMKQLGLAANEPIEIRSALIMSDGEFGWEDSIKVISNAKSVKTNLYCTPFVNNQWVFIWEDCRDFGSGTVAQSNLWSQNIRPDGTMGGTSSSNVQLNPFSGIELSVSPNPASDYVRISFDNHSGSSQKVKMTIIGINGNMVAEVYSGNLLPGEHMIEWNRPSHVSSGVYILRVDTPSGTSYAKMVLR